ncbi:MAG: potassium channel family protein [Minisyncoccia bacterium]
MRKTTREVLSFIHEKITGVKPPPGFLASFCVFIFLLFVGMIFYSYSEKWGYIDSLYFSVITLATVGYGNLHPTNPMSKIFTIFYVLIGVGLALYVATSLSRSIVEGKEKQIKKIDELMKLLDKTVNISDNSEDKR